MERPITASATLHVPADDACAVLVDDPAAVLAPETRGAARRGPTFVVELNVGTRSGSAASQSVALHLGAVEVDCAGRASFRVTWKATGGHNLFPTFRGRLIVAGGVIDDGRAGGDAGGGDARLILEGVYRPPLRVVGAFGDGIIGHRIARASLDAFVAEAARRVDAEVARRMGHAAFRPAVGGDPSRFLAP